MRLDDFTPRQIDAQIASRVFGMTWWKHGRINVYTPLEPDDIDVPDYWFRQEPPADLTDDMLGDELPRFSTDVAAMWAVVEKCEQDRIGRLSLVRLGWDQDRPRIWEATIFRFAISDGATGRAESAPMAICVAALLTTTTPSNIVHKTD